MAIVTGDRYLDSLVKFVEKQAGPLLEGTLVLKLNPVGLHYVQSRIEALQELEGLLAGAPVDYLRAYISDLGDHRALEQLRRILRLLTSLKVVSVLPPPARDPTPVSLMPFGRLKVLELRGCDLSTSAARGLLELRHTLEKIICHNSTDALRHVFTSRIADIKDSPVWSRLTFVSCACNDLLVMDESLQLLPVVETLDLSRNRFAKIDNLRKCTKLRHLDLGFNHLRTITSFSEVSCSIVKLVLRNNALTKLHGIENLNSLEGLDLSYNIISIFSELEILASLPNLQSLWLEGNPICCARWYRSQVFSFFTHPEKLKLDEKGISPREFWNRQIILASRHKRPSGFGFYSPAKDGAEEGSTNIKRKKLSRLACIENEEQKRYLCSESADQESGSCDSEVRSREENAISDGETEIINLINKVECMKKESSVLWLREVKEWMDQDSENMVRLRHPDKENYMKKGKSNRYFGESSRSAADLVQTSADESSTNILESDHSFAESSVGLHDLSHFNSIGEPASEPLLMDSNIETRSGLRIRGTDLKKGEPLKVKIFNSLGRFTAHYGSMMDAKVKNKTPTAIDDIMSTSSSALPGSPPHYQEDILHRRHNLEEEFMQLSAESHSVASSDSDSSCSDDDFCEYGTSIREADWSLSEGFSFRSVDENSQIFRSDSYYDENPHVRLKGRSLFISPVDHALSTLKTRKPGHVQQLCSTGVPAVACDGGSDDIMNQEMDHLEKSKCKRKPKRRLVSLSEENDIVGCSGNSMLTSRKLNGISDVCKIELENGPGRHHLGSNDIQESHEVRRLRTKEQTWVNANQTPPADVFGGSPSGNECASFHETDEFIRKYFHSIFAESRAKETCLQYMRCDCIFVQEPGYGEREVAVILSSENKLYVLLIDAITDGSGTISGVIGCHCFEEVSEVVFGIGLQVLSLEQLQVELLQKHIYGGLKMSIFLYSMLLFWRNDSDEELWLSRSLILAEGHVLVCIEDLVQFSTLSMDTASSSQYFMLDCCCSIDNISEMAIELEESHCVTLTLDHVLHKNCCFPLIHEKQKSRTAELEREKITAGSPKWKLKWFSEETLFKFVALLKASHVETTASPLPVRYIS